MRHLVTGKNKSSELSAIKLAQEICTHGLEEQAPDSLQKACEELRRIL